MSFFVSILNSLLIAYFLLALFKFIQSRDCCLVFNTAICLRLKSNLPLPCLGTLWDEIKGIDKSKHMAYSKAAFGTNKVCE